MFSKSVILALSLHLAIQSEPTNFTIENNKRVLQELPFANKLDFEESARGLIAPLPNNGIIKNAQGEIVWDLSKYQFLAGDKAAPDTVNPSLWRQAQLLLNAGLFKVTDRIYQVRGADLSNMTIIEGKDGIIVIDPLVSMETAKAALDLYFQNRPKKPISTIIYTHSHVDHFGGVKGIISQDDVNSGKIKVFAPKGFTDAALDENVMAGNAMGRRASYMYGSLLKPGPLGQTSSGLGLTTSTGTTSLILPTDLITHTGEERVIDGLKFQFIYAPNSEAPAEMMFYLPELKALASAEDATHTMHNLYTLRGAKVRDAKAWASYLNQAIEMFGPQSEVVFAQHHWPKWGSDRVVEFLEKQRDMYKYLHDQSLHLANKGYTMLEVGEMLRLPPSLSQEWYNRGYYGSPNHNAKSVYNFYLGWFDGNPSTLHQLPPTEASKKYVEYMGGPQVIMDRAKKDYDQGNYRWAAQVMNHIVYADPSNKPAKDFLADILEQLGYQAENGTWRNFYLTGAQELRNGIAKLPAPNLDSPDVISAMPMSLLLDYFSILLNGPKAADNPLLFNLNLPDRNEQYVVQIKNGVLNYFPNKNNPKAQATIALNRSDLDKLLFKQETIESLVQGNKIKVEGDQQILSKFFALLDHFNFWFNIVEPRP